MSQVKQSEQEMMHAIYSFAADLLRQGRSSDDIAMRLTDKGLDPQSASIVVTNLIEMKNQALRKAGARNVLFGALWCAGGLAMTIATYITAAQAREGGHIVIAWGAVLFGGLQFGRGVMQRLKGVNNLV